MGGEALYRNHLHHRHRIEGDALARKFRTEGGQGGLHPTVGGEVRAGGGAEGEHRRGGRDGGGIHNSLFVIAGADAAQRFPGGGELGDESGEALRVQGGAVTTGDDDAHCGGGAGDAADPIGTEGVGLLETGEGETSAAQRGGCGGRRFRDGGRCRGSRGSWDDGRGGCRGCILGGHWGGGELTARPHNEGFQRGCGKQVRHCHLAACLHKRSGNSGGGQRISAQGEEVHRLGTGPFGCQLGGEHFRFLSQDSRPRIDNLLLETVQLRDAHYTGRVFRGDGTTVRAGSGSANSGASSANGRGNCGAGDRGLRRCRGTPIAGSLLMLVAFQLGRQQAPVNLPIRGMRQALPRHHHRRHHIIRQFGCQLCS